MIDIILLIFKVWGYGIPIAFVVFGISAGMDRYYDNSMSEVIAGAVLWPLVVVSWLIDLWRYW